MIRSYLMCCAVACAVLFSSVATAANVDLSLNLEFNDPADQSSGGTWTAVAKADESGLAGVSILAMDVDAAPTSINSAITGFNIFLTQTVGPVTEAVTGSDLVVSIFDVGVIGGTWASNYVDPVGIAPLPGQADLGSFTGGAAVIAGTFSAGMIPQLLETSGTFAAGANVYNATGQPIAASLNLTVRTVVPEPATFALLGVSLCCLVATRRRA